MRARAPTSRAAHATAWPWLPALAATTPAARCSALSDEMRLDAPRIWVVLHGTLDVLLRARGRDREDFAREVPPAPLVELPGRFEIRAVLGELVPELRHVLAARRLGQHDRWPPRAFTVERENR